MLGEDKLGDSKIETIELGDLTIFLSWPEIRKYSNITTNQHGKCVTLRKIFNQMTDKMGNEHILFVPYQRAGIVFAYEELDLKNELISRLLNVQLANYMLHYIHAKEKMRRNMVKDSFVLDIISAFIGTKVKVDDDGSLLYEEENQVSLGSEWYSDFMKEITNMLLPLIDLESLAYVFIEYPEAYIHPAYQILFLLVILSLVQRGYKFIIATNSDLMVSLLGDLVRYNVGKEQIEKVLKTIFKLDSLSPTIEKIIEDAEKTVKEAKMKTYYFENGTVKEIPVKELTYNVPGITKEVIDVIVDWETELMDE